MSAVSVAQARRGEITKRHIREIASLDRDIARGPWGPGGQRSDYLAGQIEFLKAEKSRLEGEIERMGNLSDEELARELVPEMIPQREVTKADITPARGQTITPEIIYMNTDAPAPFQRRGGDTAMPWASQGSGAPVPGITYTYDADGQLIPAG
jgi:hypothetical protein